MTEHDSCAHPNSQKDGRQRRKTVRFLEISNKKIINTLMLKIYIIKKNRLENANHGGLHPCDNNGFILH